MRAGRALLGIETGTTLIADGVAGVTGNDAAANEIAKLRADVMVYRISGAFFFDATARNSVRRTRLAAGPRVPEVRYAPEIEDAVAMTRIEKPAQRNGSKAYSLP